MYMRFYFKMQMMILEISNHNLKLKIKFSEHYFPHNWWVFILGATELNYSVVVLPREETVYCCSRTILNITK